MKDSRRLRERIIYVASSGRSGSTLLEMLLGAQESMASMGEIHLWPHEIIRTGPTLPCGCGLDIHDCSFWAEMRRRVDPLTQPHPRIDYFRERHTAGRTVRLPKLASFFTSTHPVHGRGMARYGSNNRDVFQAFADTYESVEGVRPDGLVDASKDPYRMLWLIESGLFDMDVLHITKDPRSYVFSEGRGLWMSDDTGPRAREQRAEVLTRRAIGWLVTNELVAAAARHHLPAERYLHVQYEELASDPSEVMRRVCDFVGAEWDPGTVDDFRARQTHSMGGNPMRQQQRPIELDEQWRDRLPGYAQHVATMLTTPLRSQLGY